MRFTQSSIEVLIMQAKLQKDLNSSSDKYLMGLDVIRNKSP